MSAANAGFWRVSSFFICALCAVLGACASDEPATAIQAPAAEELPASQPPPGPRFQPAPQAVAAPIRPLAYYKWAQAATVQELRVERRRIASRRTPADPVIDTVHLGILMSLPAHATPEDEAAALELLSSLDAAGVVDAPEDFTHLSESSREYALFAGFLLEHLQQRAELRSAQSRAAASRAQLETLERENRQLQEKIDALTSIEEQLIEREQAQGDDQ